MNIMLFRGIFPELGSCLLSFVKGFSSEKGHGRDGRGWRDSDEDSGAEVFCVLSRKNRSSLIKELKLFTTAPRRVSLPWLSSAKALIRNGTICVVGKWVTPFRALLDLFVELGRGAPQ